MALAPEQVRQLIRESGDKQQWHADGRSLFLVTRRERGFWVLHFRDPREGGAIRNTSLGTADAMSAAAARKAARSLMTALDEGRPVTIGTRKARGELFGTAAATYLDNHADEWNQRTRADNKALFAKYAAPLADKPVTEITADDVAETLRPIWDGPGNNRGSRLRRLMFGVFGAKNVHPNPAAWDDGPLPGLLSRKRPAVVNRPSMPYAEVPAFLKTKTDSVEDRAGRFIILAAVRRKEALEAKWSEFDFANCVWHIPAARMKMKRPHRVPLTDAMIDALGKAGEPDSYVFPSPRTGGVMGHKALDKEWVPGFTLHGFRSSFSTWAAEQDKGRKYPFEVREAALAHSKATPVAAAYDRSELFEARQALMTEWSKFATGN